MLPKIEKFVVWSHVSTSNHMIMRVITEKSPVAYQTKFWNHRERSEGDFYILFDNQGWFFRNHPKIMWFLVNHMLSKDLFNTIQMPVVGSTCKIPWLLFHFTQGDPFAIIAAILDCVATTVFRHFTFLSIKLQKINVLTPKFVPGHFLGRETRFST